MIHVIDGEIINVGAFDTVHKRCAVDLYPVRIAFDRHGEEAEYISFESVEKRDVAWAKLISEIEGQFNKNIPQIIEKDMAPKDKTPGEIKSDIVKKINKLRKKGNTFRDIAEILNDENIETFSGRGIWHAQTLHSLLKRS